MPSLCDGTARRGPAEQIGVVRGLQDAVEEPWETRLEVLAPEPVQSRRPLRPLLDHARLAQHLEMVGARRLGDRQGEAAAGVVALAVGQLGDDAQPHRIAQRVQDSAELELLHRGVSDRFSRVR